MKISTKTTFKDEYHGNYAKFTLKYKLVFTKIAMNIKILTVIILSVLSSAVLGNQARFATDKLQVISLVQNDDQSFVFFKDEQGNRLVVNSESFSEFSGAKYRLKKISGNNVFLENEFGIEVQIIQNSDVKNTTSSTQPSRAQKKYRNINLRLPTEGSLELAKTKLLSRLTKFSPGLASLAQPYDVEFKRNFAGRPGVLIKGFADKLQALGIALEEEDIVLSVNSVPANELNELIEVLTSGEKVYLVEYERNKKLAMMKVEFK